MSTNKQYQEFIDCFVNFKDSRVKPFSPNFDASIIDKVRNKAMKGEMPNEEFEILYDNFVCISKAMKIVYDQVYSAQKSIIQDIKTPAYDIISHLVALVNCNYCATVQKLNQQFAQMDNTVQPYNKLTSIKIESIDPNVGLLPMDTTIEMQIEILSMLINYIRYFRDTKYDDNPEDGIKYVEAIKGLFLNMNGLCAFKSDYDDSILNRGFIRIDTEKKKILFDYFNHNDLALLLTGSIALNQKVMHEYNKNLKGDLFDKYYTGKRIKKMEITDGKVYLKYSCGKNSCLEDKSRSFAASITSYYDYLKDVKLPNFDNSTVLEAISIWVLLQALADYIQRNFNWNFNIIAKEDFEKVPCRISKTVLQEYLCNLSNLPTTKIKKILKAFVSSPDAFCDMWNEPLYDCGDYFTFPLISISQGMTYNIIDIILEKGGIDLQSRGPVFEKFIVSEMSKNHQLGYKRDVYGSRKYERNKWRTVYGSRNRDVYGSRKYERNKGDYQEIDCIIELKNLVIVAELKCIQYPMNHLNHHDCWKRLKDGCDQAVKKVQFVKDNPKVFQKLSTTIPGKQIVPVVVTNYPNYTGFSHSGVFIIDAHAFTSYLNTGVLTANTLSKNEGNQIVGISYLYKNEVEYASNFTDYLRENPVLKLIKKDIVIREMVHPDIFGMNTRVVYAASEAESSPILPN